MIQVELGGSNEDLYDRLVDAFAHSRPRPRALIVSFPHNPTTRVVDLGFMERLVALARENEALVVHDFAYADVFFDGYEPPSILQVPGADEVAVETYSLTKSFSMAGWRVGFALGNAPALAALARLKSYLDYGTFQPIQIASIVALNEERDYPAEACEIYRKRRNVLCDGLARVGWHVERPLGTMFVWAPIPEPYRELGSLEFAVKLTREAHVAVSPGVGFGPGGEGYVRFALVENEQRIAQAVRGIRRALPELAAARDALDRRGFPVAARDAVALGRVGDGGGHDANDLAVEDARDDVLRPELVGADHAGDRVARRELHSFGDVAGAHVERAAKDAGEREHVVDLVRVVRPAGRDDGGEPFELLRCYLRRRVGHREDDRVLGHRPDGVDRDCTRL